MRSRCRSCTAPIVWVRTEATEKKPTRAMPLDADPTDDTPLARADGNLVIIAHDNDGTPVVRYVPKGKGKYVSHFATCPEAASHRRRKR